MLLIDPRTTPASPRDAQPTIGLIGMGAMGKMYAKYLSDAGWLKCVVFDHKHDMFPHHHEALELTRLFHFS